MTKPNELKIENLIKSPVRSEGLRIFDAENKAIRVELDDCSINETEALCDFIADAINKAAALESENAKLKASIQKIESDLTNGDFCRYVEHAQDHCGCAEIHKYFKEISAQEAQG